MLKKTKKLWRLLGPGFITGASDDDPSGIATYSQAGAQFGLKTLWTAWVTLPMMIVVLEMFSRLSLVTSRGLAKNLRLHYSKWFIYFVIILTLPAIVFNIGADLAGMGAVANLMFPAVSSSVFSAIFAILIIMLLVYFSYERMAATLKWLCLALLVYFVVPFLVKQDWLEVLKHTAIPTIKWSRDYIYIIVAIIGTTISPYLFFWQSSMCLEHKNHRKLVMKVDAQMEEMQLDVNIGMVFSNLAMFFIILTAASVLYPAGVTNIETVEQAAAALKPLAGEYAYILFAVGVIGTGLLSIPVLAGSIAYFLSDMFDWTVGIDKKWSEARNFYLVGGGAIVVGFIFSLSELTAIEALVYTAVAYGVTCPPMIALILHMCNNEHVMHHHTNNWVTNLIGGLALVITSLAALALILNYFV